MADLPRRLTINSERKASAMPELRRYQIVFNGRVNFALGYLYGDPNVEDGTYIRTARIVERDESIVRTASKSYLLKDPA